MMAVEASGATRWRSGFSMAMLLVKEVKSKKRAVTPGLGPQSLCAPRLRV